MTHQPLKVFMLCSGLGHIVRGYEAFARTCFDSLADDPAIDLRLFKGGGESTAKEIRLRNLHREGQMNALVCKLTRRDPHWIEQVTFALSLMSYIKREKPDVVYSFERTLCKMLMQWRQRAKLDFKILFRNGAPVVAPYPYCDHVQQVVPKYLEEALAAGEPPEKHTLLPAGIAISRELTMLSPDDRAALRAKLELPTDRPIVISVGAVNHWQKRMDCVVKELGKLPAPRPFLLILGQREPETPDVIAMAEEALGSGNYAIRSVPQSAMSDHYSASDIFALASPGEGFGRVYVEAMSFGLPCLVHDYEVTRYIFGESLLAGDLKQPGTLASLLRAQLENPPTAEERQRRHQRAYEQFSWEALRPRYIALFRAGAGRGGDTERATPEQERSGWSSAAL